MAEFAATPPATANIGIGGLKPCAKVGPILARQTALRGNQRIACSQKRSFETRKGHVAPWPVQQRARKAKARGIAMFGLLLDMRTTGLWQTEKPRRLVERFAGGVVDRAAKPGEFLAAAHDQKLTMPARYKQQQVWIGDKVRQPWGQCMTRQMVHPDQRQTCRNGDPLGAHHP